MVLCLKIASLLAALLLQGVQVQVSAQTAIVPSTPQAEQSKYTAARRIWDARNPLFYNYQITVVCAGCASLNYPWRHTVETNIVNGLGQGISTVKGIDSKHNPLPFFDDMVDHFNRIQTAINSNQELVYAVYDPTYGFPTFFQISSADGVSNLSARTITVHAFPTASLQTLNARNSAWWNQLNIQTYTYLYTDHLDTLNIQWPRTVTVTNGQVSGSTDRNGNPTTASNFPFPWTFLQYFRSIDRQISSNAPYIEVYYDTTYGFPTFVAFLDVNRFGFWHEISFGSRPLP
jgi:hypothetical protein